VREKQKHKQTWAQIFMGDDGACVIAMDLAARHTIDIVGMMYAGIAKLCMDVFVCRELSGEMWLVADPNSRCGTSQHIILSIFSALVLVFYIIGYPAAMGYVLWKKQENSEIHNKRTLATLGTLYARYESPYMWWEAWRTTQMDLLVCIQVLLWQDPRMQGNFALTLILVSFATHIVKQPYASYLLDKPDTLNYGFNCWWAIRKLRFYIYVG